MALIVVNAVNSTAKYAQVISCYHKKNAAAFFYQLVRITTVLINHHKSVWLAQVIVLTRCETVRYVLQLHQ